MRQVRYSKTFARAIDTLLAQGEPKFGAAVVRSKRKLVRETAEHYLAHFLAAKRPDRSLGLTIYPVDKTLFVILYDYDDAELRVHFIFHRHADLTELDPTSVEW
jgi:hypothetical protein